MAEKYTYILILYHALIIISTDWRARFSCGYLNHTSLHEKCSRQTEGGQEETRDPCLARLTPAQGRLAEPHGEPQRPGEAGEVVENGASITTYMAIQPQRAA